MPERCVCKLVAAMAQRPARGCRFLLADNLIVGVALTAVQESAVSVCTIGQQMPGCRRSHSLLARDAHGSTSRPPAVVILATLPRLLQKLADRSANSLLELHMLAQVTWDHNICIRQVQGCSLP